LTKDDVPGIAFISLEHNPHTIILPSSGKNLVLTKVLGGLYTFTIVRDGEDNGIFKVEFEKRKQYFLTGISQLCSITK
jgi:hypothetical protein